MRALTFRNAALALACVVTLAVTGAVLADDYEDPIFPESLVQPVAAFGDVEVDPKDVGGEWIDAREAVEPLMTVMLMTGEINPSPGETVEVAAGPVFEATP